MSDLVALPIAVLLSIASGIVGGLATVIGVLWRTLAARDEAHAKAMTALAESKDRAEQGRLDDLRSSAQLVRETQERGLPLLERVAVELRMANERRARRRNDSDPPRAEDLESTLTRIRRLDEEAARAREELASSITRGGTSKGSGP